VNFWDGMYCRRRRQTLSLDTNPAPCLTLLVKTNSLRTQVWTFLFGFYFCFYFKFVFAVRFSVGAGARPGMALNDAAPALNCANFKTASSKMLWPRQHCSQILCYCYVQCCRLAEILGRNTQEWLHKIQCVRKNLPIFFVRFIKKRPKRCRTQFFIKTCISCTDLLYFLTILLCVNYNKISLLEKTEWKFSPVVKYLGLSGRKHLPGVGSTGTVV
jgi:hypothetical protein